jgi:Lar family restriction alleviation protein
MVLKPCPFCGRAPRHTQRGASLGSPSTTGEVHFLACACGECSAHAHQFGWSLVDVASKWNRRAPCESETEKP